MSRSSCGRSANVLSQTATRRFRKRGRAVINRSFTERQYTRNAPTPSGPEFRQFFLLTGKAYDMLRVNNSRARRISASG